MNKKLTFLLSLTFLISGSTTVSAKPKFGDYEGAIYVRNYDGDTITFNLPNLHPIIGKKIRVRLNGIDTPEIKGKCDKEKYDAEQAREMVGDILKDGVIEKIDHKNINVDVDFMKDQMSSTENLAIGIWEQIEDEIMKLGGELAKIKLVETENNYVEYFGGKEPF